MRRASTTSGWSSAMRTRAAVSVTVVLSLDFSRLSMAYQGNSRFSIGDCRWIAFESGSRKPINNRQSANLQSVEPDAVKAVPSRHVREHYFVTDAEALQDFHRIHRCAAQLDLHPDRILTAVHDLEQTHRALWLTESRTPYIENVIEVLDLDSAVDAQLGNRAGRQRTIQFHVNGAGAV